MDRTCALPPALRALWVRVGASVSSNLVVRGLSDDDPLSRPGAWFHPGALVINTRVAGALRKGDIITPFAKPRVPSTPPVIQHPAPPPPIAALRACTVWAMGWCPTRAWRAVLGWMEHQSFTSDWPPSPLYSE